MEDAGQIRKKRALTSERARWVRQSGHNDALEFAIAIGLSRDYKNDQRAKKDVIDLSGDSYSVKSGEKKWQIFLYGEERFKTDPAFQVMNGIGALLVECINCFPATFSEYQGDKARAKESLRIHMRTLLEKLGEKTRLRAFFDKSIFNYGEVNYLVVKHDGKFHVFLNKDVLDAFSENLTVANSQARHEGHTAEQKVLFCYKGRTLAELEMRNDSDIHYREVRFNMLKPKAMQLLIEHILITGEYGDKVIIYGNAIKKFGHWRR